MTIVLSSCFMFELKVDMVVLTQSLSPVKKSVFYHCDDFATLLIRTVERYVV